MFCRHENFVAHKKHYCQARETTVSNSPPPPGTPSPPLVQLICAACGIKFASMDNLVAHQAFYCPKRPESQEHHARCSKCKVSSKEQTNNLKGYLTLSKTFTFSKEKPEKFLWTKSRYLLTFIERPECVTSSPLTFENCLKSFQDLFFKNRFLSRLMLLFNFIILFRDEKGWG